MQKYHIDSGLIYSEASIAKTCASVDVGSRQLPWALLGFSKTAIAVLRAVNQVVSEELVAGAEYETDFLANNSAVQAVEFMEMT